jgi:hypothetical protein
MRRSTEPGKPSLAQLNKVINSEKEKKKAKIHFNTILTTSRHH